MNMIAMHKQQRTKGKNALKNSQIITHNKNITVQNTKDHHQTHPPGKTNFTTEQFIK